MRLSNENIAYRRLCKRLFDELIETRQHANASNVEAINETLKLAEACGRNRGRRVGKRFYKSAVFFAFTIKS